MYHDETDEEPDVERDGGLHQSQQNSQSPASNKNGRLERRTSNASETLMTPQMRSMRLIGNSNPRYQWFVRRTIWENVRDIAHKALD